MRTLYESILDDEEVLVGDTTKDINNPLKVIRDMLGDTPWQLSRSNMHTINDLLLESLKDVPGDLRISSGRDTIWVNSANSNDSLEIITLRPSHLWMNTYIKDKKSKLAIWFLETNVDPTAIKDYGFRSMKSYEKWKNDFIEKYNLTPSEDEYLYTL